MRLKEAGPFTKKFLPDMKRAIQSKDESSIEVMIDKLYEAGFEAGAGG